TQMLPLALHDALPICIGYIGLGIMGRGMAANLLKAGFSLTVWNRTIARMDDLVAQGAHAGASPADVAARSDTIVVCVSDTPDVQDRKSTRLNSSPVKI